MRTKLRGEIPLVFSLPRHAFLGVTSFIRGQAKPSAAPTITGESRELSGADQKEVKLNLTFHLISLLLLPLHSKRMFK